MSDPKILEQHLRSCDYRSGNVPCPQQGNTSEHHCRQMANRRQQVDEVDRGRLSAAPRRGNLVRHDLPLTQLEC